MRDIKPIVLLFLVGALAAPLIARSNDAEATLTFSTGATITLPLASAKAASESTPTPNGLVAARSYLLDENTDPNFKLLFRLNKLERQTVGESDAIYSELDTRIPKEVREGAAYHATAGYLLCQRDTLVNLMLWLKSRSLDRPLREHLIAIAKSLRAKPR